MALAVTCGECAAALNIPDRLAGRKVRCKTCGAVTAAPREPTGRRPTRHPAAEPDDARRSRPRTNRGGRGLRITKGRVALALLAIWGVWTLIGMASEAALSSLTLLMFFGGALGMVLGGVAVVLQTVWQNPVGWLVLFIVRSRLFHRLVNRGWVQPIDFDRNTGGAGLLLVGAMVALMLAAVDMLVQLQVHGRLPGTP